MPTTNPYVPTCEMDLTVIHLQLLAAAKAKIDQHRFGLKLVFHGVGISCLAGAVFLELLVFLGILGQGAFLGVEGNPAILNAELGCSVFCVIYLVYIAVTSLRSLLHPQR